MAKILKGYVVVILVAAMAAGLVRLFILEGFRIPTDFMAPGIRAGDLIFVNKLRYGFRYPTTGYASTMLAVPKRGDVVIFSLSTDSGHEYIKRVIAVPGDRVSIKNKQVFLNGQSISSPYEKKSDRVVFQERLSDRTYFVHWDSKVDENSQDLSEVEVPQGQLFLLGDSRSQGNDSRQWGFVPVASVLGKAWFVWMSLREGHFQWSRILRGVD